MNLKPWQKNILSMIVIVIGGFLLFNLAFLLNAFVTNAVIHFMGMKLGGFSHVIGRGFALCLIILISWFVFRFRLSDTIKAAFLTMPTMVILVMIGIGFYRQSKWIIAGIGALIIFAMLSYFYKKKLSWLYSFATLYVAALALFILLSGMEI